MKATDRERKRLKGFVQRFPFKRKEGEKRMPWLGLQVCAVYPVYPAEAPGSSVPICRQETPADGCHEEEKAVICQEVSPLDREELAGSNVFRRVHLQDHQLQEQKSPEAIQREPLQAALHHHHHQALSLRHGVRMLQWPEGEGRFVIPPRTV